MNVNQTDKFDVFNYKGKFYMIGFPYSVFCVRYSAAMSNVCPDERNWKFKENECLQKPCGSDASNKESRSHPDRI